MLGVYIDIISSRWTIQSWSSELMFQNTGRIALNVQKEVDGVDVTAEILLVPTGGANPIFTGDVMFRNVRCMVPGGSLDPVHIGAVWGGTKEAFHDVESYNRDSEHKSKGLLFEHREHANMPSLVDFVTSTMDLVILRGKAQQWGTGGTAGWHLAQLTASAGAMRPHHQGGPRGSVPLRFLFSNPTTGQHITLHVVVRADGSLRVNWQGIRTQKVGQPVYNILGDKTSGERLPQWWNPADIRVSSTDLTRRYQPAAGKTMLETFLAGIPFTLPAWKKDAP